MFVFLPCIYQFNYKCWLSFKVQMFFCHMKLICVFLILNWLLHCVSILRDVHVQIVAYTYMYVWLRLYRRNYYMTHKMEMDISEFRVFSLQCIYNFRQIMRYLCFLSIKKQLVDMLDTKVLYSRTIRDYSTLYLRLMFTHIYSSKSKI